jgi:hypothetical protein
LPVEEKVNEIRRATKNALASLNTSLKTKLIRLPKSVKGMPVEHLSSGVANPEEKRAGKRAKKNDQHVEGPVATGTQTTDDKALKNNVEEDDAGQGTALDALSPPVEFTRAKSRVAEGASAHSATTYNGIPLQTPMPFTGKAIPLPVQMLTVQQQGKKAGGKTKATRDAPQAAIVTTKDGKQWAVGMNGLSDIPESHRQEVADYLTSQFSFLQDALRLR